MATTSNVEGCDMLQMRRAEMQEHSNPIKETAMKNICVNFEEPEEPKEACMKQDPACGSAGKPLYISTSNAHPASGQDCYTVGIKGYGGPHQHLFYTTSNSTYGRLPAPPELNNKKFYKNSRFTIHQRNGGNYKDVHFTASSGD